MGAMCNICSTFADIDNPICNCGAVKLFYFSPTSIVVFTDNILTVDLVTLYKAENTIKQFYKHCPLVFMKPSMVHNSMVEGLFSTYSQRTHNEEVQASEAAVRC